MSENGDILLFESEDGEVNIEVHLSDDTVWLTLDRMAELFQRDKSVVSRHIKNVIDSGELQENSVVANYATTASDGKTYQVNYFSLDMVISVGYRVNSYRGVQFRIWATKALKEYMIKGFVMDDERLSGRKNNYFDELYERVRKIRTSEANFYQKVRDIFATSIDYNPKAETATMFFKTIQNKFHFAITGYTAPEIIATRVNASKPKMGLVHTKGKEATRAEIHNAKNYLEELELKRLELLVEGFLVHAELQVVEQHPMYMKDWVQKLDDFIRFNGKKILTNAGKVSRQFADVLADEEYEIYARKLLEQGDGSSDFTKTDFENAVRKVVGRPDNASG